MKYGPTNWCDAVIEKVYEMGREPARAQMPRHHRVGKFVADYSPVTQAELDDPSQELDELFRNSTPVARS